MNCLGFALTVALVLGGCSNQQLYESVYQSNLEKCNRMPMGQREKCLATLENDYPDYERKRQEAIGAKN